MNMLWTTTWLIWTRKYPHAVSWTRNLKKPMFVFTLNLKGDMTIYVL